jgi:hypothetical protein
VFFFEKKNQKTFATWPRSLAQAPGTDSGRKAQKFFGSFFQKRTACLPFLAASAFRNARTVLLACTPPVWQPGV